MLGAWWVLLSVKWVFRICFPWSWFVSLSCWHNSTMASFVVVIFLVCYWYTLNVFISSLNMSMVMYSETMFFSLTFSVISNTNLPCRLVVPLLIRLDLLKVGLAQFWHLVRILFVLPVKDFLLSKNLTRVHLIHHLCDFFVSRPSWFWLFKLPQILA